LVSEVSSCDNSSVHTSESSEEENILGVMNQKKQHLKRRMSVMSEKDMSTSNILNLTRKGILINQAATPNDKNVEVDYVDGEKIIFNSDVYNFTIAANLTRTLPPQLINYCISKCLMVFLIQFFIAGGYFWDFRKLNNFQDINIMLTSVRVIFAILI
jgi:hypothetical protein